MTAGHCSSPKGARRCTFGVNKLQQYWGEKGQSSTVNLSARRCSTVTRGPADGSTTNDREFLHSLTRLAARSTSKDFGSLCMGKYMHPSAMRIQRENGVTLSAYVNLKSSTPWGEQGRAW